MNIWNGVFFGEYGYMDYNCNDLYNASTDENTVEAENGEEWIDGANYGITGIKW